MIRKQLITILLFIISNPLIGQSFFDHAVGHWKGKGALFGMEAAFQMAWTKELNDQFVKLEFENRFTDPAGNERVMTAHAYYNPISKKGLWFDSRGQALPLVLEISDAKLVVLWGSSESEEGRTIYDIISADQMHVVDFVKRENGYEQFGEASYRLKNTD